MTIDWSSFTPAAAIAGGVLIGLSATMFVLLNGRIAGISGILGGLIKPSHGDVAWRVAFVAWLLGVPALYLLVAHRPQLDIEAGHGALIAAGLLVGPPGTSIGAW